MEQRKKRFSGADRYLYGTSYRTKWLYLRRKILSRVKGAIPRELWIGVTHRCQCNCVHCYVGSMLNRPAEELSGEELRRVIKNARRLGFLDICFLGGEPLLRGDITELIRLASSMGLLTTIYTNGILVTRERARELKEAGLFFCCVSIDSAVAEEHNRLRGHAGCFEKATAGITYLQEAGIRCSIWTYAAKKDVKENGCRGLKDVIALGRRLGVLKVVILFPIASGKWMRCGENNLTLEERQRVRALVDPPFVALEFPWEDAKCVGGRRMLYLNAEGEAYPCPTVPYSFGNIRSEPLGTVIRRMQANFERPREEGCGECVMNRSSFRERLGMEDGRDKSGFMSGGDL